VFAGNCISPRAPGPPHGGPGSADLVQVQSRRSQSGWKRARCHRLCRGRLRAPGWPQARAPWFW